MVIRGHQRPGFGNYRNKVKMGLKILRQKCSTTRKKIKGRTRLITMAFNS